MDTPDSLARDMLKAAAEAIVGARGIVQKGSLNIKNEARKNVAQSAPDAQRARRSTRSPTTPRSTPRASSPAARSATTRTRPGGDLGNLLEYGAPRRGNSPPHRDLGRAFDSELRPLRGRASALMAKNLL
jgi:hypothetical protein